MTVSPKENANCKVNAVIKKKKKLLVLKNVVQTFDRQRIIFFYQFKRPEYCCAVSKYLVQKFAD